jgi:hypothetical protein
MRRFKIMGLAFVAVLATSGLALVTVAAQAQAALPGTHARSAHVGPYVKIGAKTYQYCTPALGCFHAALFLYPKTMEWEAPEVSIHKGTYKIEKIGKKKYTVFTTTEEGATCVITAKRDKTGFASEAEPGKVICEDSEGVYINEAWWANKV